MVGIQEFASEIPLEELRGISRQLAEMKVPTIKINGERYYIIQAMEEPNDGTARS